MYRSICINDGIINLNYVKIVTRDELNNTPRICFELTDDNSLNFDFICRKARDNCYDTVKLLMCIPEETIKELEMSINIEHYTDKIKIHENGENKFVDDNGNEVK